MLERSFIVKKWDFSRVKYLFSEKTSEKYEYSDRFIAFIIRTQCKDKVTGNLENQTYWFKHLVGSDILLDLSIPEKNSFLQYEQNKFRGN